MKLKPPVKMEAALDVILSAQNHSSARDEYHGSARFYFDKLRCIEYRSRWHLKTKTGATERIRREAIEYLQDLHYQIDEVLLMLKTVEPNEYGAIHVYASVYEKEQS